MGDEGPGTGRADAIRWPQQPHPRPVIVIFVLLFQVVGDALGPGAFWPEGQPQVRCLAAVRSVRTLTHLPERLHPHSVIAIC